MICLCIGDVPQCSIDSLGVLVTFLSAQSTAWVAYQGSSLDGRGCQVSTHRKSKKDRQFNDQAKKEKRTTKDCVDCLFFCLRLLITPLWYLQALLKRT
jgi:hypothetical protein